MADTIVSVNSKYVNDATGHIAAMNYLFADRREAGRLLALLLAIYRKRPDVMVLALPRGGVLVGAEIADALGVPFDLLTVRKLGVPGRDEVAMGAIAATGEIVLDAELIGYYGITQEEIDMVLRREQHELERREAQYRGGSPPPRLSGRTVILVDDGLATGATMRAAVHAADALGAVTVVVAVPVGSREACDEIAKECGAVITVRRPTSFTSVGSWYHDFHPVTDAEVLAVLTRYSTPRAEAGVR